MDLMDPVAIRFEQRITALENELVIAKNRVQELERHLSINGQVNYSSPYPYGAHGYYNGQGRLYGIEMAVGILTEKSKAQQVLIERLVERLVEVGKLSDKFGNRVKTIGVEMANSSFQYSHSDFWAMMKALPDR